MANLNKLAPSIIKRDHWASTISLVQSTCLRSCFIQLLKVVHDTEPSKLWLSFEINCQLLINTDFSTYERIFCSGYFLWRNTFYWLLHVSRQQSRVFIAFCLWIWRINIFSLFCIPESAFKLWLMSKCRNGTCGRIKSFCGFVQQQPLFASIVVL